MQNRHLRGKRRVYLDRLLSSGSIESFALGRTHQTPEPMLNPGKTASPLEVIFREQCFTPVEGMNWLQDRGLVSDNCVTVADVAMVDQVRVERLYRARREAK